MQRARDQLLAGAGLAGHEHRRAAARGAAHQIEHAAHGRALRDHAVEREALAQLGAQEAVLAREARHVQRPAHQLNQLLVLEGLLHVVEGALAHGRERGRHGRVRGHQDHGQLRIERARAAQHLEPVRTRHTQIGDEAVDGILLERREEFL